MEHATKEELRRMVAKPCPVCGEDRHYFICHGVEEARIICDKMCPIHPTNRLKNCLTADSGSHMGV